MRWASTVNLAVCTVNILLAVYNLRLLILASRYYSMTCSLLRGAWRMRDWPMPTFISPRLDPQAFQQRKGWR